MFVYDLYLPSIDAIESDQGVELARAESAYVRGDGVARESTRRALAQLGEELRGGAGFGAVQHTACGEQLAGVERQGGRWWGDVLDCAGTSTVEAQVISQLEEGNARTPAKRVSRVDSRQTARMG